MSRPGFTEGVLVAVALAVAGAMSVAVLTPLLGLALTLRLLVTALAGVYLGYLLRRSTVRTGRLVVPMLWLAATAAGWALLGFVAFTLSQIALIWLVRALYHHGGVLAALADLGLTGLGVLAGIWALGSGSWLLALWTFFLVQALFTWIPTSREPDGETDIDDHGFEQAREIAEAALQRLATGR